MKKNYYMVNEQKILYVASELFRRGYGLFQVVPSVSPNGMAWRCCFVSKANGERHSIIVSNWIDQFISNENMEINKSIQELSVILENENLEFFSKCKGYDQEYIEWYNEMLNKLEEGELPYAFADYFSSDDYWETSLKNKIKKLPKEKYIE
jgi:hypothetical protein